MTVRDAFALAGHPVPTGAVIEFTGVSEMDPDRWVWWNDEYYSWWPLPEGTDWSWPTQHNSYVQHLYIDLSNFQAHDCLDALPDIVRAVVPETSSETRQPEQKGEAEVSTKPDDVSELAWLTVEKIFDLKDIGSDDAEDVARSIQKAINTALATKQEGAPQDVAGWEECEPTEAMFAVCGGTLLLPRPDEFRFFSLSGGSGLTITEIKDFCGRFYRPTYTQKALGEKPEVILEGVATFSFTRTTEEIMGFTAKLETPFKDGMTISPGRHHVSITKLQDGKADE